MTTDTHLANLVDTAAANAVLANGWWEKYIKNLNAEYAKEVSGKYRAHERWQHWSKEREKAEAELFRYMTLSDLVLAVSDTHRATIEQLDGKPFLSLSKQDGERIEA